MSETPSNNRHITVLTSTQENGLQRVTSHSNDASTAPTPDKEAAQEPLLVTFDGLDDPLNPQNWPV